jgi:thymidylate synthase ThyX
MITAEIIADSVSEQGKRITTFRLRYPKFIHGEFMTHRMISRNASSSRAVPFSRLLAEVRGDNRAAPVHWGAEQKGMQSGEELNVNKAVNSWARAAHSAANCAQELADLGLHKSIVNRVIEPFTHINVVATATEWENFFGLRLDKAAQPEIQWLARKMWFARKESQPKLLKPGQWHLPFVSDEDTDTGGIYDEQQAIKVSVARCARVSYQSLAEPSKRSTVEEDFKLYEQLIEAKPMHASPAEHQATPDRLLEGHGSRQWYVPEEHGNFIGWRQYRKMLSGEAVAPLPEEYRQ